MISSPGPKRATDNSFTPFISSVRLRIGCLHIMRRCLSRLRSSHRTRRRERRSRRATALRMGRRTNLRAECLRSCNSLGDICACYISRPRIVTYVRSHYSPSLIISLNIPCKAGLGNTLFTEMPRRLTLITITDTSLKTTRSMRKKVATSSLAPTISPWTEIALSPCVTSEGKLIFDLPAGRVPGFMEPVRKGP